MIFKMHKHARGFSLVELSVSLVVVGILAALLWRWVIATKEPATEQEIQFELKQAQAALEGFVLANNRLPCASNSAAGVEDCSVLSAVNYPWRTLGTSSRLGQLHYGVNRGGGVDLAQNPGATISPDFGIDFTGAPQLATTAAVSTTASILAQTAITTAQARRTVINGLDWCFVLRKYASNTAAANVLRVGNAATNIPVAYILVHPGVNNQFDGNNVAGGGGGFLYDLPGRAQDSRYDDRALAIGSGDLSTRLGCVSRMSAARTASQAAFAQYDVTRVMQEYWSLRNFDVQAADSAVDGAKVGVAMAAIGLALTATSAAVGAASALNTEGLTAVFVVVQIASVALAVAENVLAAADLADAETALVDSRNKLSATETYAARTYELLAESLSKATTIDQRGLNP